MDKCFVAVLFKTQFFCSTICCCCAFNILPPLVRNPLYILHYDFHNVCQLCLLIIKNKYHRNHFSRLFYVTERRISLGDKDAGRGLSMMNELLIVWAGKVKKLWHEMAMVYDVIGSRNRFFLSHIWKGFERRKLWWIMQLCFDFVN